MMIRISEVDAAECWAGCTIMIPRGLGWWDLYEYDESISFCGSLMSPVTIKVTSFRPSYKASHFA